MARTRTISPPPPTSAAGRRGLCRGAHRAGAGAGGEGRAARHRHRHRRPEPASRHRDRRGGPRRHRADEICGTTPMPARPRWRWRWRRSPASIPKTAWSAPSAASRRRRARSTSFPAACVFTVDLRVADRRACGWQPSQRFEAEAQTHRRARAGSTSRSSCFTRSRPRIARRRCRRRWRRASPISATRRSGCRPAPATTRR